MAVIEFDAAAFRALFPELDCNNFTNAQIEAFWITATAYVSDCNYGWLNGPRRALAINYMAAHLAALQALVRAGETPGLVNAATIDKISVTLTVAPQPNQWQWWLGLNPYGMNLLALLQVNSVGGWYTGGSCEISAFRKAYGRF